MEAFKKILGKSNNVSLIKHSQNVAKVGDLMVRNIYANDNEIYRAYVYVSGLLHDIGKCTELFQKHLSDPSIDYPLHNLSGFLFCSHMIENISVGKTCIEENVAHSVLYHHPLPYTNDNHNSDINTCVDMLTQEDLDVAYDMIVSLLTEAKNKFNTIEFSMYPKEDVMDKDYMRSQKIPTYFPDSSETKTITEYLRSLFMHCVICPADTIASHIEKTSDDFEENNIDTEITKWLVRPCGKSFDSFEKPEGFDERFDTQVNEVIKITEDSNPIKSFITQTGFGKTMVGLMFLLYNTKRKGYWVCHQNSNVESTYESLKKELKNLGLDDTVRIAKYYKGEYIEGDKDCDIIVTNIDNLYLPLCKSYLNNTDSVNGIFQILTANIVVDEYHEYISKSAICAAFDVLCRFRSLYNTNGSRLLLMSATEEKFFNYKKMTSFYFDYERMLNCENILDFKGKEDWDSLTPNSQTIAFTNCVSTCQCLMNKGKVNKLCHSRYTDSHKKEILKELVDTHNKNNTDDTSYSSTNIASTGIDFSFKHVMTIATTPNEFIQRLGRHNRFNLENGTHITVVELGNDNTSDSYSLKIRSLEKNRINSKDFSELTIARKWFDFLKEQSKAKEDKNGVIVVTNRDLFDWRKNFHKAYENEIKRLYVRMASISYKNLSEIQYELVTQKDETEEIKISDKANLRSSDSDKLFIKLQNTEGGWIDEPYEVEDYVINFEDFTGVELEKIAKLSNLDFKKDTGNGRKALLRKAKSSLHPLYVPKDMGVYYDNVLGLVKIQKLRT